MPSKMKEKKVVSEGKEDGKKNSTSKPQKKSGVQRTKSTRKNCKETTPISGEITSKTRKSENTEVETNVITTSETVRSSSRSRKKTIDADRGLTETSNKAKPKTEKQSMGTKTKRKADSKTESEVPKIESKKGKFSKSSVKKEDKKCQSVSKTLKTRKPVDSHNQEITTENNVLDEQIDTNITNLKSKKKLNKQRTKTAKIGQPEVNTTSSPKIVKDAKNTANKNKLTDCSMSTMDMKKETDDNLNAENTEIEQEPQLGSPNLPDVTTTTNCSEVSFMSDSDSDDFEEVEESENFSGKRKCLIKDEAFKESPPKKSKMDAVPETLPLSNSCNKSGKNCKGKNSTTEKLRTTESTSSAKTGKRPVRQKGKAKVSDASPENIKTPKSQVKMKSEATSKKSGKTSSNNIVIKNENNNHISLPEIDENDVTSVLLRMEGQSQMSTMATGADNSSLDSDSEEKESDWEEVADHHSPVKSQIPDKPVEITLDLPGILKKRKKKKFDWKAWVQRKIRRFQKDVRIGMHKVELLCLLSHGMLQNKICNEENLLGHALSLVPATMCRQNLKSLDIDGLKRLVRSLKSVISHDCLSRERRSGLMDSFSLQKVFESQEITTEKELVLILIILLRALGFDVRLVMSFQPLPLKEVDPAKKKNKPSNTRKTKKESDDQKEKLKEKQKNVNQPVKSEKQPENKNKKTSKNTSKSDSGKSCKAKSSQKLKPKNTLRRKSASKIKSYACDLNSDSGSEDFVPDYSGNESNYSEENCKVKNRRNSGKKSKRKNDQQEVEQEGESSSSDFKEEDVEYRSPEAEKSKKLLMKNNKILSSDSSDTGDTVTGTDIWLEVYLQEEKKWICVDCIQLEINKPYEIEATATAPLHYCLAYSNDGSIKDVTARYASQWLSHTRKLRVDSDWWRETLIVYRSEAEHNEQDDENIKDQLVNRPLPTSIAQFKNHPLYVLQRHLLKFEAIYPDTAVPVGYVRKEPVFARECVHVLHSRENWMKEGRAVKIGEQPYKMVKSRPKWNKPKEDPDKLDLELFGEWQTDIYIPPPAVDGKVPRNEYGNVELFKPWMLPGGTVHLKVPALNRIAKKLGVDCVAAMVGWDYHGGFSHAMLEGWVVCEEHAESLMAAWEEDQLIQQQKEVEKIEKRVIGNWQQLTRGLLIKEKLKKKYDLQEEVKVKQQKKSRKKSSQSEEVATDAAMSWPRRQMGPNDATTHFTTETI